MSSPLQTNITNLQELLERANSLPEEIVLPTLSNPATSSDMLLGKQLIDADCNVVTGTIPSQEAQIITPSTSNKTIASGRYLTGTQTIEGDSNLKAENIKSGVSIFGVTGTHVCESSGVTIQRSDSGSSFTTSTNGTATVTCGFKPDFVTIYLTTYEGNEEGLSFPFAEQNNPSNPYRAIGYFSNGIYDMTAIRSATGFSVTVIDGGWDFDTTPANKKTFDYIAIKYT